MANFFLLPAHSTLNNLSSGATISAGMPLSNLNTDEPSELARMESVDPGKTYILYDVSDTIADSAVIVNHNGRDTYLYARVVTVASTTTSPAVQTLSPDAMPSSTGVTGTFSDVDDDPFAIDGNVVSFPDPSDALFSFPTPTTNPVTGTDIQAFYITTTGTSGGTLTATLYEAGNPLAASLAMSLGTSTQVHEFTWDASLLSTASGANVQLHIENNGGGATGEVEAISWVCERDTTGGAGYVVDSGWINCGSRVLSSLYPTAPTANGVILMPDDGTSLAASRKSMIRFRNHRNSDGYIQLGGLYVGEGLTTTLNRDYGPLVGVMDLSVKKRTHGGQTFGVKRPRLRTIDLPMSGLSAAEAFEIYEKVCIHKGVLSPMFVSLVPKDATEGKHTSIWATLESSSTLDRRDPSEFRQMQLTFVEKL